MERHRDAKLADEIYYVVLRFLQLRNTYAKTKNTSKISSVKYQGKELGWNPKLATINLKDLEAKEAKKLGESVGFMGSKRGRKTDITINDISITKNGINYIDFDMPLTGDSYKFFIWDSFGNIRPFVYDTEIFS